MQIQRGTYRGDLKARERLQTSLCHSTHRSGPASATATATARHGWRGARRTRQSGGGGAVEEAAPEKGAGAEGPLLAVALHVSGLVAPSASLG